MINYIFLESKVGIKSELIEKIKLLLTKNQKLPEEDYEQFHEMCMDYIQRFCFDENYKLTSDGKILEQMMDKVFDLQEKEDSMRR